MKNNVYNTFINVIEVLKKDKNTKSIILVGSSKDITVESDYHIKDIDLFILVADQEENQIRKIKKINDIEFDMNFISIKGCHSFIETKTYFFLNIKDGKLLYDVDDVGKGILSLCEEKYEEGPDRIPFEEKKFQANQLISDISRLKEINEYDDFEYDFLIFMYLSKVIKLFYIINDNWVPKDKKLLKALKKDEPCLYELASQIVENKKEEKYETLLKAADYIWGDL